MAVGSSKRSFNWVFPQCSHKYLNVTVLTIDVLDQSVLGGWCDQYHPGNMYFSWSFLLSFFYYFILGAHLIFLHSSWWAVPGWDIGSRWANSAVSVPHPPRNKLGIRCMTNFFSRPFSPPPPPVGGGPCIPKARVLILHCWWGHELMATWRNERANHCTTVAQCFPQGSEGSDSLVNVKLSGKSSYGMLRSQMDLPHTNQN